MPGFVDVTGWSAHDIKRLGQRDDDDFDISYRNPYAYRKPYAKKPAFSYDSDKVWGAAVIAYRINQGYVKAIAPGLPQVKTNRQLIEEMLIDPSKISQFEIEEGRKIRQYFNALTFKVIEGKTLSPFLKSAMEIANKEQITDNLGIGTIASLPATYDKMTARDTVDRRINWARGGFLGKEGDKVTAKIEVVKKLWSQNYSTWYITGITDDDKVLFFSYKKEINIGDYVTIEGKVKSHRDTSTQLSHVKVI